MFVRKLKAIIFVMGLLVSSSSVLHAQGAWVSVASRIQRSGPFDPTGQHNVKHESEQSDSYGPVVSSESDCFGPKTRIGVTRAIDGIEIKAYSNLTCTDKKMGASVKCGGMSVNALWYNGVNRGYADGFLHQVDRFRVDGPVGGQSKLDMRLEIDGTLALVGNRAGDRAGVSMFGEVYFPSLLSSSDLYGLNGVLNNSAPAVVSSSTEPTSPFDWGGSWNPASAGVNEKAWDLAYDQTEFEVLMVPNNTDFVIIHYLRVDVQSDGAGNGAVSDFFNGTSFELSLSTPASGTNLVRLSCIVLGDSNLDGSVDFSDIPEFVAILTAGDFLEQADCKEDGVVDFADIPEFIKILSGS